MLILQPLGENSPAVLILVVWELVGQLVAPQARVQALCHYSMFSTVRRMGSPDLTAWYYRLLGTEVWAIAGGDNYKTLS